MLSKLQVALAGVVISVSSITTVQASDYGCKALLCFAGGKNVSECASTIAQVKRDLAKGKVFPHCDLVSGSFTNHDGSNGKEVSYSTSGKFTRKLGKHNNVCPDGSITSWYKDKNYRCNAIVLTIKGMNEDGSDNVQEINW